MRLRVRAGQEAHEVELRPGKVVVDGVAHAARVDGQGPEFEVLLGRRKHTVRVEGGRVWVDGVPQDVRVEPLPPATAAGHGQGAAGPVHPPMPGRVVAIKVQAGQEVRAGQCLVVLEAMKMQNEVAAPAAGKVAEVRAREGQLVEPKDVLVVLA